MYQSGCHSAFYNLQAFTPYIILLITPLLICVLSSLNFFYITYVFSIALTYDPCPIKGLSMCCYPILK